jgi:hypothetical protein
MTIEKVANPHRNSDKQPEKIWANIQMDELRRTECLCLNCERTREDSHYTSCPIAKTLYTMAIKNDMAMAITRCGATNELGNLLYVPRKKTGETPASHGIRSNPFGILSETFKVVAGK